MNAYSVTVRVGSFQTTREIMVVAESLSKAVELADTQHRTVLGAVHVGTVDIIQARECTCKEVS